MHFDVVEVGCRLESLVVPVQTAKPEVDSWVPVTDGVEIALKVPSVHRVKPNLQIMQGQIMVPDLWRRCTHNRDEETDVGLSEAVANKVCLAFEHALDTV